MSVYSELINDRGFDPGAPGPSARFAGWGYYNPHGDAWIRINAGMDAETAQIPIVLDPFLFSLEVTDETAEAAEAEQV